jgi:ribonuclease Y
MIKDMEEQARKIANRRAKEIVTDAIQRTAIDHVSAATTAIVQLTDDEMKGRIIGREGRNIRAFESATGVDVIIDDTPGAVVLSSFDPIRREVAKISLESLVADGRIHPTRVEEAVERAQKQLQEIIREKGEAAADEVGLKFHPKIIELLGKLAYRTSYGQNILAHSLEAAHIAGIMAQELGVNVALAKRGSMLHDIGKAIDFEQQGTHVHLGEEICRKYGESDELINCINAHHEEEEPDTIEAVIVMMADAISSARPGARRESVDAYIKRLEKLETLAGSFEGVEKAYAIQAGREIRVMVKPEEVDDPGAHKLAFDIAKKIESEVDYPGEVKVSVIRQTRAVGVAK